MKNKSETSSSSRGDNHSETRSPSRRGTLKRLAAGGAVAGVAAAAPSRWTRPVVESVVLPVHAQTSATGCIAPEGCYEVGEFGATLYWPGGGPGPFDVEIFDGPGCDGPIGLIPMVVASSLEEAEALLSCGPLGAIALPTEPPSDGCLFYQCEQENCLLHGTDVLLPDGRSRGIETLAVGDIVAALDHDTGGIKPAVVTRIVTDHRRDEYWRINNSLLITNDHPVLAAEESGVAWRRVDDLAEGMEIQGVHGRTAIASLEHVRKPARTVYMETTADNFIAVPRGVEYVVKARYGAAIQCSRADEGSTVHA